MLEVPNESTFVEIINKVNDKYLIIVNYLLEKFKYHDDLAGPLGADLKFIKDKLTDNNFAIIDIITDNFLFCLEQVSDHNADYFTYQKEKVKKSNGKSYKNKLSKIGQRTLFKRVLKDSDPKFIDKLFSDLIEIFNLLVLNDSDGNMIFNEEYVEYVKENFNENKNFSKMIMVFDNVDSILSISNDEEVINVDAELTDPTSEDSTSKKSKGKTKKSKKSKDPTNMMGEQFMKGLENTKIAQLAKNISEKINIDDFPGLTDPSKLLSSLSDPNSDGGIQNLLKFVVGEVEQAFKGENINEKDLVNEAQNIMGQFQNMSGFDPMSMLKNNNLDLSQFADIFSKMKK